MLLVEHVGELPARRADSADGPRARAAAHLEKAHSSSERSAPPPWNDVTDYTLQPHYTCTVDRGH
eukprot:2332523-Prymnesium_polylepis.1